MTTDLLPMIQSDGSIAYLQPRQLGDAFSSISKGSGIVATGAATTASLLTTGSGAAAAIFGSAAAAQIIPVVGQIAGAIAVVAGVIAMQRAKTKAIKASLANVEEQRMELIRQNNELDNAIYNTAVSAQNIIDQIKSIGQQQPQQLNGFGDWLKKTFTPQKYYGEKIEQASTDIDSLNAQAEGKINILSGMQKEMQQLADTLTEGKNLQVLKKVLIYGGGSAVALYGLYELIKYLRS